MDGTPSFGNGTPPRPFRGRPAMTNDSKLGLVIGVGLVILIAVLFFRRDLATAKAMPETAVAARPGAVPAPTITHQGPRQSRFVGYKHIVSDGDTLFSLALRYYNDGSRFGDIYQANRDVLAAPDQLPPGT